MGKPTVEITRKQAALIRNAPLFFVSSADPELQNGPDGIGPVNLSPKGGTPLHILGPNRVAYLDYGGSGNETARHAEMHGPITLMICSFEEDNAAVVKLYGRARAVPLEESEIADLVRKGVGDEPSMRERQVIEVDVDRTVTSCGYTVPVMNFVRERRKEDRGLRYNSK